MAGGSPDMCREAGAAWRWPLTEKRAVHRPAPPLAMTRALTAAPSQCRPAGRQEPPMSRGAVEPIPRAQAVGQTAQQEAAPARRKHPMSRRSTESIPRPQAARRPTQQEAAPARREPPMSRRPVEPVPRAQAVGRPAQTETAPVHPGNSPGRVPPLPQIPHSWHAPRPSVAA